MPLTLFPVTGTLKAVISDATDAAGAPDVENISSFCYFTPSESQIFHQTDLVIYQLKVIRARSNSSDGVIVNIDGTPVSLVANTPDLGLAAPLTYLVSFDHVVIDQRADVITAFRFAAPPDATPVDLSTVERLPVK
jgi:hypothetical protein